MSAPHRPAPSAACVDEGIEEEDCLAPPCKLTGCRQCGVQRVRRARPNYSERQSERMGAPEPVSLLAIHESLKRRAQPLCQPGRGGAGCGPVAGSHPADRSARRSAPSSENVKTPMAPIPVFRMLIVAVRCGLRQRRRRPLWLGRHLGIRPAVWPLRQSVCSAATLFTLSPHFCP